ncbi:hypothetical protein Tco_0736792 [Tanacetum coccineum]
MASTSNRRGKVKTSQPWTTTEEIALNGGGGLFEDTIPSSSNEKNSIRPKVVAFSVVYDSVQQMDENGSSDLVLFQNELAEFEISRQTDHVFSVKSTVFSKCLGHNKKSIECRAEDVVHKSKHQKGEKHTAYSST